jgi:hypothetical protein
MVWLFGMFTGGVGVGGLTPELRAELEPEGIIAVAEKVGAVQRFSGSVPGRHDGVSVSRHKGLVVCTRRRKRVDPRFSGEVSTTFTTHFSDDVLAALPERSLAFHVSPAYVFSILGVRVRP